MGSGVLPPTLSLEMLRQPHGSVPINPLLAEPLYLTRYIERMGTGTRDMIRWSRLIETYHYLGSARMFGPRIRYLVRCDLDERPVALFGYNRASLKVGVRERFVDWNEKTKLKHIDGVVCQNRFLILPHVRAQSRVAASPPPGGFVSQNNG